MLSREEVPLPAFVDDWALAECQSRGVTFGAIALEALRCLRALHEDGPSSLQRSEADMEDWAVAQAEIFGSGVADRYTEALCLLCEDRTGENLLGMADEWRRLPPEVEARRQQRADRRTVSAAELEERRVLARKRYESHSAAWRAAGRPRDPSKVWNRAVRELVIPASERFNVYVWPEQIGERLTGDEADALLARARTTIEYQGHSVNDFEAWPVSAEPMPADPTERLQARLRWLRSLGLTVPWPGDDSPERRAWEAWKSQRARLRERR